MIIISVGQVIAAFRPARLSKVTKRCLYQSYLRTDVVTRWMLLISSAGSFSFLVGTGKSDSRDRIDLVARGFFSVFFFSIIPIYRNMS